MVGIHKGGYVLQEAPGSLTGFARGTSESQIFNDHINMGSTSKHTQSFHSTMRLKTVIPHGPSPRAAADLCLLFFFF